MTKTLANAMDNSFQASRNELACSHLKKLSRRLRAAFSTYRDELEVLDRLYYKNRNQHSAALFWKRVEEMRRYCTRLNKMNLGPIVEEVRISLLPSGPRENLQPVKEVQSSRLNRATIVSSRRHLAVAITLADKVSSFHIAMQTGAFLQLILTISAIASRLMALTTEIGNTARLITSVLDRILSSLDHAPEPKIIPGLSGVEHELREMPEPGSGADDEPLTLRTRPSLRPCTPQSLELVVVATPVPVCLCSVFYGYCMPSHLPQRK
ncbi:hypothetical protein BD779DRAFT_1501870 [Infundibulicybe gibba]|nr:hypothetical protein BD779DRAFT_1501870 [Infundibulicybe gibba]